MLAFYRAQLTRQEEAETDEDSSDDSSEDDVEQPEVSDEDENIGAIVLDAMSDIEIEFED